VFDYVVAVENNCGYDTARGTITVKIACPEQVRDSVNNINYPVIELAGICWYQENVRGILYQDSTDIPFAKAYYNLMYPDMLHNEQNFGLLYTYEDLLLGDLCPEGWRIPTSNEWALLKQYSAQTLKNPLFWLTPNTNTNKTLFDARAAGFYNSTFNRFEKLYGYTAWWSSDDALNSAFATAAMLNYYCDYLEIISLKKVHAISVRCLMDE
jgi:uncharacterized protein (TIGR02145 family)